MKYKISQLLLPIIVLVLFSFHNVTTIDCKKIKNGKFYYYSKKSRERINVLRKDSLQLEIGTKDSAPIKSRIIWKSDCEYDMYLNALSDTKLTEFDSLMASTPAHIQVIYIGKKFYVCTVSLTIPEKEIKLRDTIYFRN